MKRSFVGAAIVLLGAAITLLFGLQTLPKVSDQTVGGMTAILGTVAYISAKRRRLYSCEYPWLFRMVEVVFLAGVCIPRIPWTLCLLAARRPDLAGWSIHWETTIAVPSVTMAAYLWAARKRVPDPADW